MTSNNVASTLTIEPFAASDAGAWSNSYLVMGASEILLFDVPMLRSDAKRLVDIIQSTGKTLKTIMISHAHPDHFLTLDFMAEKFPDAQIVSTANVALDIERDGAFIVPMLKGKLGPEAPEKLVVPAHLKTGKLAIDGTELEVIEYGEGESKHNATLYIKDQKDLLCADLLYNGAHLYLAEKHPQSWAARLDELEEFVLINGVATIHPGHGSAGGASLIEQTRAYLRAFLEAIESGDAQAATQKLLKEYPAYHAPQFLTVFSIPAYFPTTAT